ncbi:MAG TPA: inner membrane CreD family protein, partial [Phenylobacterium sp.]
MTDLRGSYFQARIPRRSIGLKLLLVCGLALLMSIPALFVFALLSDRTNRADEVSREIGQTVGGQQAFLGPVLAIPYTFATGDKDRPVGSDVLVVFPVQGDAQIGSKTQVRQRSLFKVPVYEADIRFKAAFDLTGVLAQAPQGVLLDWSRAEFLVGASDPRGAKSDIVLRAGGQALPFAPATTL